MANNITVKWMQVSNFQLESDGEGLSNANYDNLYSDTTKTSILNFGNVQAGKVTNIKCVVAQFSGASHVSDLQFWLDSTSANATGSTNVDLSGTGWEFYHCIVPKSKLNFNIETTTFSEAQKKGQTSSGTETTVSYLDEKNTFYMTPLKRTPDEVAVNQFADTTNTNEALAIDIEDNGTGDSHLIMLDVQTPVDANSGNTEGWYYRMNFLYS